MKVLDQTGGIKIAAGDPLTHLAFLIAASLLPKHTKCDTRNFDVVVNLLIANHAINFSRLIIGIVLTQIRAMYPAKQFLADFSERLYNLLCTILSIWTIIVV
jgi:hypothetical protein